MNMNLIYLIVAIVMLVSAMVYITNDQPDEGWQKRFHSIMQVVFFIVNLLSLVFISKNPYKPENVTITVAMIVLYIIPILVYTIQFVCYVQKREKTNMMVLWLIYILFFFPVFLTSKQIDSEKILQERADIINYRENEVYSTFLNDSLEGTDYVVVKKTQDGKTTKDIIKTRTYNDDDTVNLYLHQESSYIEEYYTVETYISFLGFTSKQVRDEKIYEIYLTDDMYEQK